jgi:GNAT superfamily N-acetyltransferase
MEQHELFVDWSPDSRDHAALLRSLVRDNAARGGPSGHRNIAVIVRDPHDGEATSGVWGSILYGWLFIELLYVAESGRRQGLGSRLLMAVENAAQEQGCIGAWLSSYAFQAPGFYKNNGYEEFGELGGSSASTGAADNGLRFFRKQFRR